MTHSRPRASKRIWIGFTTPCCSEAKRFTSKPSATWKEASSAAGSSGSAARAEMPNTKHQTPKKLQIQNLNMRFDDVTCRKDGRCLGRWAWNFFGTWSLKFGAFIADILWLVPRFPFLSPQLTARTPPAPLETSECSGCDDHGCSAVRCGRRPGTPNSADASN